jgi:hypothetical protein
MELRNIYLSRDIKSVPELYGQRMYNSKSYKRHLYNLVGNACETMAHSTMVPLINISTHKTVALSNQKCFFLDICYKTSLNAHQFSETHWVVNICFTVRLPEYYCGGNCGCVWFQFICDMAQLLCDKCPLQDTAASYTVGLFGKKIEQCVLIYTIHTVESSVPKGTVYWHRRLMKPSTAVSSCVKAKVSECGVTSDRELAVCVLKSQGWPQ